MSTAIVSKIEGILTSAFNMSNYVDLMNEVFDNMKMVAPDRFHKEFSNFSSHIEGYYHVGNYTTPDKKSILVLAVQLKSMAYVENSRSTQRSYAKKLIENGGVDAAMIAFFTAGDERWRLSFVRLDYEMKIENGRMKTTENMTPARRYSFLVGKDEPCHTAIDRFYTYITSGNAYPTLDDLENAFSVERVTNEFFNLYCEKFQQLREALEANEDFRIEAEQHSFTSAQFAKKLMGQIVFLYFLQKKGWLGVSAWPKELNGTAFKKAYYAKGARSRQLIPQVYRQVNEDCYRISGKALAALSNEDEEILAGCVNGDPWGTGPRNFMRKLLEIAEQRKANFFDDYLEPLFYDALNRNRGEQGYDPALHCRIPFLSGGLFEPIDGYDWEHNDFNLPNSIFSNRSEKGERDADGILDIFDRYNFTMSEDEPMEREVAIDPEMLGKVFENLLDVVDRKSKGAFYTPREIVHYMCQESLINYLTNSLKVSEAAIRDFILYGDFMKDQDGDALQALKDGTLKVNRTELYISEELYQLGDDGQPVVDRMPELDKALADVRVADPAVGSGAFPLGMLNEIVRARQNITTYIGLTLRARDPKRAAYNMRVLLMDKRNARQLKYETVRDCIFAADIEPSAVDIAQLRLWLALVIDDEINPNANDDTEGHRNPLPLPNLECNILCGNSLIDEFEGIKLINESELLGNISNNKQQNFFQFGFDELLEKLIAKQNELFKCDDTAHKQALLSEINALKDKVVASQLSGASMSTLKRYDESKRSASKPYMLWQLEFCRVFREKGGFDIVIGNPPYVQLQKSISEEGKKLGDLYVNQRFRTFEKTGDLYCLFYEKGWTLLHSGGTLSFITSNKWMKAGYGKSLREFFSMLTNPIKLIDFAGQKIFETATVDVNILIFTKEENKGQTIACLAKESCRNNLSVYVEQEGATTKYNTSDSWTVLDSKEQGIKHKVESIGIPLKQWNIEINYGIKTGFNDAFIVDEQTKDKLISEDPKSAELIRPILRGRDIKRYSYTFANLWIIATFPSKKYNIDDYPAVKKHLLSFGIERLEQTGKTHMIDGVKVKARKKTSNRWFETQDSIKYWDDFLKQKIAYREISDKMDACIVEPDIYLNNKCYLITGDHLIYLVSIFNSTLFNKVMLQSANTTGGKGFAFLEKIRIPYPSSEIEQRFIELYSKRMESIDRDSSAIDRQIDDLVYSIYNLTKEEIDSLHKN